MLTSLLLSTIVAVQVQSQSLRVTIDPEAHSLAFESTISVRDAGVLAMQLSDRITLESVQAQGKSLEHHDTPMGHGTRRVEVTLPDGATQLILKGHGTFEEDVAAGEKPGQIHNFSVDATIGPDGVFLSEGSAWHPQPLDENGQPMLITLNVDITPIDGWAFVASGDPVGDVALDEPCWQWTSPRGLEGVALVGNKHELHGVTHQTPAGPVEIVMHVPADHASAAPMYLEAAAKYLDLYVPKLGKFPYKRFSIVENFFSSGFAYPGFTLLGPQVVAMAPRSLAPGYLDHELLHNWWGNGVYVDPADGNWCEALTSFGANYWRRIADDGEDAGRDYRRGILMKLSTDPAALDDGPLGAFGSADPSSPGPDRFVGYDKGSFVFAMLADVLSQATSQPLNGSNDPFWASLRRFAQQNLGKRATWKDIQTACEASMPNRPAGWLDGFFKFWVREHALPHTVTQGATDAQRAFIDQIPIATQQMIEIRTNVDRSECEIDPQFRIYRTLPPQQLVPTIAGTMGPGGVHVITSETRGEVTSYFPQLDDQADGENLLLIGADAVRKNAALIARTGNPVTLGENSFTLDGSTFDQPDHALLHTMHHPDKPGRYITVYLSNGDAGWSHLRLIQFYSRDTSIIWDDAGVAERKVFEPDRTLPCR